jgi:hypothetical protein
MAGLVVCAALAAAFPEAALAAAKGTRSTAVFDEATGVVNTVNDGLILLVRSLGIATIVGAAIWMLLTQRIQGRFIAAIVIGLLMASLAGPLVDLLFPGKSG